jgi:hypothetical protein
LYATAGEDSIGAPTVTCQSAVQVPLQAVGNAYSDPSVDPTYTCEANAAALAVIGPPVAALQISAPLVRENAYSDPSSEPAYTTFPATVGAAVMPPPVAALQSGAQIACPHPFAENARSVPTAVPTYTTPLLMVTGEVIAAPPAGLLQRGAQVAPVAPQVVENASSCPFDDPTYTTPEANAGVVRLDPPTPPFQSR